MFGREKGGPAGGHFRQHQWSSLRPAAVVVVADDVLSLSLRFSSFFSFSIPKASGADFAFS